MKFAIVGLQDLATKLSVYRMVAEEKEMSTVFLKIKLKSLAEEARIIRAQEKRTKGAQYNELRESLYLHRVKVVRRASRETLLAYCFLRGRTYARVEQPTIGHEPDWKAVAVMVKKYGNGTDAQATELAKWKEQK